MLWTNKKKVINPIPSTVEISLLKRAYAAQPNNHQVLGKLVDNLLHENQLDHAIKLCKDHQQQYPQDDHVYTLLTYLYRKTSNLDALIEMGEVALQHSPRVDTRLLLAYAYAQQGLIDQAIATLPSNDQCLKMQNSQLSLVFKTLLSIQQPEQVYTLYHALRPSQSFDSGLKSYYLQALYKLGKKAEIDRIVNHQGLIKEYRLAELNEGLDVDHLNRELESFFLSHPKQQYEPGNHTTRYGSQMHFESDWHPVLRDLEDKIKAVVELYLFEQPSLKTDSFQSFTLNLWSNSLNKKGYQVSHIHPDAFISGVYYISVPPSIKQAKDSDDRQGYLLFSQAETSNLRYVQPDEGLIVLFPSYFYHETLPLEHDETRVCVAFDVIGKSTSNLRVC